MKLDRVIAVRNNKTIYKDGDMCIKVFNNIYSKAEVLNEALNQARIEETGLNVPKVLEITEIEGKWAVVSEFIEGKTLERLLEENEKEKEEYLKLFVEIQLKIHRQKCPLLNKLKDKLKTKIDASVLDEAVRYELKTRIEGMPEHEKVCHGDFNPSNIIIKKGGEPYILDWSHAASGNASADAARSYLLFKLSGRENFAENYLNLFCKMSNISMQYVQKWLPIIAASYIGVSNEREREMLLEWIDVMDYE